MKKKMLAVILCGVLALSTLTACGGGEESAPAPAKVEESAPEKEEATQDEADDEVEEEQAAEAEADGAVTDESWAELQDLYVSLDEAYNATLEMYNDDSIAQDDKIEEALTTAEELMTEVANIDRADVSEADVESLVEAMLSINDIFAAVIDNVQPAGAASDIDYTQIFTECYAGITDDENTYAYLAFGDPIAALMFYDVSTGESGSFVGSYEVNGDAIIITDENLGVTMTFTVEEGDGGYYLDMGDVGAAFVGEVSPEEFVEAMQDIANNTEPQF